MSDIRDVLQALPYPPDDATRYALTDLFTVRHRIIRGLDPAPRSVFEFGALKGFFLVTALDAASGIERVGWVYSEVHTPHSNAMCWANIREAALDGGRVPPSYAWVYTDRAQIESDPGHGTFDLVQVDSDHSYDGCLADLCAAEQLEPRWIMVDDWTADELQIEIRAATLDWLAEQVRVDVRWELTEHATVNGLALRLGARMIRRGELEYGHDMPFIVGDIHGIHHPYNPTEEEAERWAAELREREQRRRPCGFQAVWPDETPLRRIA